MFFFCGWNDCHPAKSELSDVWNYNCGRVCGLWRCLKCPYLLSNSTSAQCWSWLDNHPISIVMLPFRTGNTTRRYCRLYEYRVPYFHLTCFSPKQQSLFFWEGHCCANCNHVTCCATNKKRVLTLQRNEIIQSSFLHTAWRMIMMHASHIIAPICSAAVHSTHFWSAFNARVIITHVTLSSLI